MASCGKRPLRDVYLQTTVQHGWPCLGLQVVLVPQWVVLWLGRAGAALSGVQQQVRECVCSFWLPSWLIL